MPELLSPGVFIEEKPAASQVIQAVSTSTLGIVGYTPRGPEDKATFVSSFEQFVEVFGPQVKESYTFLSMAAYFANGGRRAYVVRVVPADATAADAKLLSSHDENIGAGDGVAVAFDSDNPLANLTALKAGPGYPIRGATVSVRWRGEAGVGVGNVNTKQRANPTANLVTIPTPVLNYEGRLDPAHASLSAFFAGALPLEPDLFVVSDSVTLEWDGSGVPKTLVLATVDGPYLTGTNGAGSTGRLDRRTGIFSIVIDAAEAPLTTDPIRATYTPAVGFTAVGDVAGVLTGSGLDVATNEVDLTTGRIRFTTTAGGTPLDGGTILVSYTLEAWALAPTSRGAWANNLRITVQGNPDAFDTATATFTKHNVNVFLVDSSGTAQLKEVFEDVDMIDPQSGSYFPDVINDLSDYVQVAVDGGDEAPLQLDGKLRTQIIAGGVAASPTVAIAGSLNKAPIARRTVVITYTDDATGLTRTVTDDGKGALIGAVSGTTNTINYTSGAFTFVPADVVREGTLVLATYYSAAAEATRTEQFGDAAKGYTAGTDGTFDSTNYGRNQFSAPALKSNYRGLYAFNRVDELLQLSVPDFAGDLVVTGDLLDYADERANQPSGGDRFVILTVPKGSSSQDAVDWLKFELGRFSRFAALYWPWVRVADPLSNNRPLTVPPLGHIAGVYARTDSNRNVAKTPAGSIDGALSFLTGLEVIPTQGDRDLVYPNKINPLIALPQTGLAIWGARTISNDSQWRYIGTRRLFMFLEKSVYNATWWIPFEPNGPALWAKITAQLNSFLLSQFNAGLFAGNTPGQAFNVVCNESNNPPESQELGQVLIDVYVAPQKPAEFVRFSFAQFTQSSP